MNNSPDNRSLLSRLRALPRGRHTDPSRALTLAERQATLLRYMTARDDGTIEEQIARLPRIRIDVTDIPTSGLSHWDGQQWVISINRTEPHTRQRLTILHEFKHIIDHPDVELLYRDRPDATAAEQMEQAADYFAGCALVPSPLLTDAYNSGTADPASLAELFDVSLPAIKVRLWQTGLTAGNARCARPASDPVYYRAAKYQRVTA